MGIIAADIGGTWTRLGHIQIDSKGQPILVEDTFRKYLNAEYSSLEAVITHFRVETGNKAIDAASIATAGYLIDDTIQSANLPWAISRATLGKSLGTDNVTIVNDFEAVAYGTLYIDQNQLTNLNPPATGHKHGARLVLGAGTGLGASILVDSGKDNPVVIGCELGLATFAPRNAYQRKLVEILESRFGTVVNETLVSGPGIGNLYAAIAELESQQEQLVDVPEIVNAAQKGTDTLAVQTLSTFCEIFGSVAGDLAMITGAKNGVWLAGGVVSHFREFFEKSNFINNFLDKGKVRKFQENIPVYILPDDGLAMPGAAGLQYNQIRS